MFHSDTLDHLNRQLGDAAAGRIDSHALVAALRSQTALLAALTPRHRTVLEDIAMRLESARLFSGESCSFNRNDLTDALGAWLGHARAHLDRAASPA